MPKYSVAVTRDSTETTHVDVEADSVYQAEEKAQYETAVYPHRFNWATDEGNSHEPYIPDAGNSAELLAEEEEPQSRYEMTDRELYTTLAALRYWAREGLMSSGHEQEIATNDGEVDSLGAEEIDALCERLNTEGAPTAPASALVVVHEGVAESVESPSVYLVILDQDNIAAGDAPPELPRGQGFEELLTQMSGLKEGRDYTFYNAEDGNDEK